MSRIEAKVPVTVRHFLAVCVDSPDQLRLLMYAHEHRSAMSAASFAAVVGSTREATRAILQTLVARGLMAMDAGPPLRYWYAPRSADLDARVEAAAGIYRQAPGLLNGIVARG
jgi:hypothetical protein